MSNEEPKLFTSKPKKLKLKAPTPITTASPSSAKASAPPPPPLPQGESFFRRYRVLVPLVLVVNFTIGAYTLFRVTMRDKGTLKEEEIRPDRPTGVASNSTASAPAAAITEKPVVAPSIQRALIPDDQQRELFKWMLEEKRKVKPRNAEEKKRIDEEKAILKQFIGAKSFPL